MHKTGTTTTAIIILLGFIQNIIESVLCTDMCVYQNPVFGYFSGRGNDCSIPISGKSLRSG